MNIRLGTEEDLDSVFTLYKQNSKTLGFMPKGAFVEGLADQRILVAASDSLVLGYLFFRRTRTRDYAAISHLCIASAHRGRGIADRLLQDLLSRVPDVLDVRAATRTDYEFVERVWRRNGFVKGASRPGRGNDGAVLQTWIRQLNELPLLAAISPSATTLLPVMIDNNIFLNMVDGDDLEVSYLQSDFLQMEVEFVVSPEIRIELNRQKDEPRRATTLAALETFREVQPPESAPTDDLLRRVHKALGQPATTSQESDQRHLAFAAASGIQYFVTQDEGVLRRSEKLRRSLGVCPIRPSDLVAHLAEVLENGLSGPVRLSGSSLRVQDARVEDRESLQTRFLNTPAGERKHRWRETLSIGFGDPGGIVEVVRSGEDICGVVVAKGEHAHLKVLAIRVDKELGRDFNALSTQLLSRLVLRASRDGYSSIALTESVGNELGPPLLRRLGFLWDQEWWKPVLSGIEIADSTNSSILDTCTTASRQERVQRILHSGGEQLAWLAWPGIFRKESEPSFLVPIQPFFAGELFDHRLSEQGLFGADPTLMFSIENVYYRSYRGFGQPERFRVYWYESTDPKSRRAVREVRFSSWVRSVRVGPAKEVYRAFKRRGIFRWEQVRAAAKGDPSGLVMAMSFTATTELPDPITWRELDDAFTASGEALRTLPSPRALPWAAQGILFGDGCPPSNP